MFSGISVEGRDGVLHVHVRMSLDSRLEALVTAVVAALVTDPLKLQAITDTMKAADDRAQAAFDAVKGVVPASSAAKPADLGNAVQSGG